MPRNYSCTNIDIPDPVLKNFTFVRERFDNRQPIMKSMNRASSYFSLDDDFVKLRTNEVNNGYKQKQQNTKIAY